MKPQLQQEKEQLQQELAMYIANIEDQKQEITEEIDTYRSNIKTKYQQSVKAINLSKTGILVLGGLYVVYWLGRLVLPAKKKESKSQERIVVRDATDSAIVRQIKSSIASFLISVAKKELMRLLKKWHEKQDAKNADR